MAGPAWHAGGPLAAHDPGTDAASGGASPTASAPRTASHARDVRFRRLTSESARVSASSSASELRDADGSEAAAQGRSGHEAAREADGDG